MLFCKNLVGFDDKNLTLTYELGKCSMQDLMEYKFENDIEWLESDLTYLTCTFLKMIQSMQLNNIF